MVLGADVAVQPAQRPLSALAKEVRSQVKIAALTSFPVELDERSLDFGMAGRTLSLAGTEYAVDIVCEALRDGEQARVAGGAAKGDGSLHEVPRAVQFVAVVQVLPAAIGLDDLPIGVEIAVRLLCGLDELHSCVRHLFQLRFGLRRQRIGDCFQPLVDIGVHEEGPSVLSVSRARSQTQIMKIAVEFELPVAVAQADGAIDALPLAPEAIRQGDGVQGQRVQLRMGTV